MKFHFRPVKDALAAPVDLALRGSARLPAPFRDALFGTGGLLLKGWYFTPASHARRAVRDICRLAGRDDPRAVYLRMMDNLLFAAAAYSRLVRDGAAGIAGQLVLDGDLLECCRRIQRDFGCGIFVVPHCAGAVLAAAGFARRFPSVILVRESRSAHRGAIMRRYFEALQTELLFVRNASPASVARGILRALGEGKFVIGATDLPRKTADTIPARVFGQTVCLPAWPARFSARRKVPIIPTYAYIEAPRIHLFAGEPFIEQDLAAATQRWADFFEKSFLLHPADWIFMFEKRWAKLLAQAAAASAKDGSPMD